MWVFGMKFKRDFRDDRVDKVYRPHKKDKNHHANLKVIGCRTIGC